MHDEAELNGPHKILQSFGRVPKSSPMCFSFVPVSDIAIGHAALFGRISILYVVSVRQWLSVDSNS